MAAKRVLVVGCVAVDIVCVPVNHFPDAGASRDFHHYELLPGGNAFNNASALAKLGMPVGLVSLVTDDSFGSFCLEQLAATGVDTSTLRLVRDPDARTSITMIFVPDSGDRSMLHCPAVMDNLRQEDITDELLARFDHLHVTGYFTLPKITPKHLATLLKRAKAAGLTTSVDCSTNPEWYPGFESIEPALKHLDLFMPSEVEAKHVTGETEPQAMVRALKARGAHSVVIKLGDQGAIYCENEDIDHAPAFTVDVVDSCGAGDGFVAGFLCYWLEGRPFRDAILFGNACGAACVGARGATAGMRERALIEAAFKL